MNVAVACGGRSHEREVSLRSGARVAHALHRLGHAPTIVDVGPAAADELRNLAPDVCFVALHGRGGEDGAVQSLLDLLDIPYTGSRVAAARTAFDKPAAKRVLEAAGVATPPWVDLGERALTQLGATAVLDRVREVVGMPAVVKPARGGSALGVSVVGDAEELPKALLTALSFDRDAIVERHVRGREIAVCVVGSPGVGRSLPPVGIAPRHASWYDYASRYETGETEFSCPAATLDEDELRAAEQAARAAFDALGCRGIARVDAIVDDDGTAWVIECSTAPGLTDTSVIPLACDAAGTSFEQLVDALIDDAFRGDAANAFATIGRR